MPYSGVRQRVSQALLATALVFAASLGYWGITSLQSPSADGMAAQSSVVSVVSEKSAYGPAESVTFTLRNDSTQPITLSSGAPFVVQRGTETVFAPVSTQGVSTLDPGQSKFWSWDQRTTDGQLVASGSYTIRVSYSVAGTTSSAETTVTINAAPTGSTTSFQINTTSGAAPLKVSLSCTGIETGFVVDFGDGITAQDVTCPITLTHSYVNPGSYTATQTKSTTERGKQTITVTGAAATTADGKSDGKGAPTKLGNVGPDLGTTLAVATLLAAIVSFLILRRPIRG